MLELIGVDGLTQWDVGRQVKVDKDVDMVHFSNRPYGYSKNVKVMDGVADVPDMFLTSCATLRVWAYVGDFEKGYTKIEKIYEVKPKNRPEDYIYTPEDVKTWEKLQSEIGDLSGLETEAKKNLVAAVNEAAKSGGAENAVLYTEQNLTNAQREQARANINAVGNEAIEFFNSEFKTHSEICKAYESGKVCYYPYAGTKLMNNAYSGRMQPFVFSGTNGMNEFLTVTVNTDDSVVYGDEGIYNLTEVPQATAEALGGVKADPATADDTQPVRIGDDGKLVTAAGKTDIPEALPNPNALTFTGAVNATYDGSTAVSVEIPSGGTDISLGLTSAAVGQTIKVKAIDESGKPTAWEAANMPSGESGEVKAWEEFMHFTVDNNETTVFDFSSNGAETLESKKAKEVYIYSPKCSSGLAGTADASGAVTVNGCVYVSGLNNFARASQGSLKLWLCAKVDSLDLWYFGRDTDVGLVK